MSSPVQISLPFPLLLHLDACAHLLLLQRFPSQLTHDGPHPQDLQPDWEVSEGEEEPGDEVVEEGDERPEDAGAGGSDQAGDSLNSDPLHEWPDDNADDLSGARGATQSAALGDAGPISRRWLRKASDAAPAGEQAVAGRSHGKQPAEPWPAEKRPVGARPRDGWKAAKKACHAAPSTGPKRAVPTSVG